MGIMSARDAAVKWKISQRRIAILCAEGRISGAMRVGNMWIIPENAHKPIDKRSLSHTKNETKTASGNSK